MKPAATQTHRWSSRCRSGWLGLVHTSPLGAGTPGTTSHMEDDRDVGATLPEGKSSSGNRTITCTRRAGLGPAAPRFPVAHRGSKATQCNAPSYSFGL